MTDYNDDCSNIKLLRNDLTNMPFPEIDYSSIVKNIVPPTIEIDEENTFAYQMQKQTDQIIEKNNEQIQLIESQNEQLIASYKQLENLYSLKETELQEAKQEAKNAKRYNTLMLIIAIVSMLIAVASWLLPNILGT